MALPNARIAAAMRHLLTTCMGHNATDPIYHWLQYNRIWRMSRLIQSKPIVSQEYQWVDDTNHRHSDKLAFGDQQDILQLIEWIEQEGVSHD